ncbi:uncharacterized protein ACMZJ9_009879 [Mantella aurantiaca]
MDVDQLKDLITEYSLHNYTLGNQGFNRILLQLFGYLGHGKSSLINSCKHVLQDRRDEFREYATAGAEDGGLTMERKSYKLTNTITIVDNRGCSTLNGYETGEVYAQLGIFPIIVLTHKASGNLSKFRSLFEDMGAEEIFAVENYTEEDHFETRGRHLQFLNLMHKVLEDVNFKMQKKIDPKKERAKHKMFLCLQCAGDLLPFRCQLPSLPLETERMDIRRIRDNIRTFSLEDGDLGSQGYSRVLLQLFGLLGHGKSSFINSCKYVLQDGERFVEHAEAAATDHGLTMKRKSYQLTDVITMVDNRGCSRMSDFEKAEVYAQLGNIFAIDQEVVWKDSFLAMMEAIENSEMNPNVTDFIVPVFVYSARQQIQSGEMEDFKVFLQNCVRMTGVFPIVVLTFKTSGNFLENERWFRLMGAEEVIAIENYTPASPIKTLGRTTDILKVIDCALRNVRFRLEQPRDPKRDRIERKKFLFNYTHQTAINQERERRERERMEMGGSLMQRYYSPSPKTNDCALL